MAIAQKLGPAQKIVNMGKNSYYVSGNIGVYISVVKRLMCYFFSISVILGGHKFVALDF